MTGILDRPPLIMIALALALPLAGCAASSGIIPAGPNTYMLTERFAVVRGGSMEAQRVAMQEANEYCSQKGRVLVPNAADVLPGMMDRKVSTGYTVTFRCLRPDDPAVPR